MNIDPYLKLMVEQNASDLFFTTGAPVCTKVEGVTRRVSRNVLEPGVVKKIAYSIMDDQQIQEFEMTKEMNLGISVAGAGRFRVNAYYQRGEISMVIRYIKGDIPEMEELGLPSALKKLVMQKNGLVLLVGSTGSGKSTSLASMIEHRNTQATGHILTIEDPIEYAFSHKKSIIGQREVGLDTLSYENALREAMREAPDLIMIGEVRDKQTMEAAITYADTGHLCLTTLHAVNANQALDRIVNFFPPEGKSQILMDLSLNLRGIVAQRLIPDVEGGRVPAVEVLINTPYVSELIKRGSVGEIKPIMEKGAASGMQTFDQSLYDLYKSERISLDDALGNADSRGNLEWQINFGGGVKSVSDSSDQLVFPDKEPVEKKPRKSRTQASVMSDTSDDQEVLDSHVGFDDEDFDGDFLDGLPSTENASVEPRKNVLDDEDGEGKDSGYFDRLKSVFGDQ